MPALTACVLAQDVGSPCRGPGPGGPRVGHAAGAQQGLSLVDDCVPPLQRWPQGAGPSRTPRIPAQGSSTPGFWIPQALGKAITPGTQQRPGPFPAFQPVPGCLSSVLWDRLSFCESVTRGQGRTGPVLKATVTKGRHPASPSGDTLLSLASRLGVPADGSLDS